MTVVTLIIILPSTSLTLSHNHVNDDVDQALISSSDRSRQKKIEYPVLIMHDDCSFTSRTLPEYNRLM